MDELQRCEHCQNRNEIWQLETLTPKRCSILNEDEVYHICDFCIEVIEGVKEKKTIKKIVISCPPFRSIKRRAKLLFPSETKDRRSYPKLTVMSPLSLLCQRLRIIRSWVHPYLS